jgi:hypothetical protein
MSTEEEVRTEEVRMEMTRLRARLRLDLMRPLLSQLLLY